MRSTDDATIDAKVRFLSDPGVYPGRPGTVALRETHMSFVFLTADRVYKLKKPVRLDYLDFSTLARRETACRAELVVNQRLARDVYLGVVPLTRSGAGYALGGEGAVADWLIVMRRLDEARMLDSAIATRRVRPADVERLVATLVRFYRRAEPVFLTAEAHRAAWHRRIAHEYARLSAPDFCVAARGPRPAVPCPAALP